MEHDVYLDQLIEELEVELEEDLGATIAGLTAVGVGGALIYKKIKTMLSDKRIKSLLAELEIVFLPHLSKEELFTLTVLVTNGDFKEVAHFVRSNDKLVKLLGTIKTTDDAFKTLIKKF